MFGGMCIVLGLIGTAMVAKKDFDYSCKVDRAGGNALFVDCHTTDDYIRRKIIHSNYPLTDSEKRRMEQRAKTEYDRLSPSYYDLYYRNYGVSLSDVVQVRGKNDIHATKLYY